MLINGWCCSNYSSTGRVHFSFRFLELDSFFLPPFCQIRVTMCNHSTTGRYFHPLASIWLRGSPPLTLKPVILRQAFSQVFPHAPRFSYTVACKALKVPSLNLSHVFPLVCPTNDPTFPFAPPSPLLFLRVYDTIFNGGPSVLFFTWSTPAMGDSIWYF